MCLASLLLLALAVPGCDDDNNDDEADLAEQEGEQIGDSLAQLADDELEDQDDIVAMGMAAEIMLTIDQGEIIQAQTALPRLTDPVAIDYANQMIIEHTDHLEDVQALIALNDLTLIETQTSAELQAASDAIVRDLTTFATDADFFYIRSQVVIHSTAIEVVDEVGNNVDDFTFFDFVDDTVQIYEDHRDQASAILRTYQ